MTTGDIRPPQPPKAYTWVKTHRKAIVGYAGFVLSLLSIAYPGANWLPPVIALATALGVHTVRNDKML